ncbi:MAG: RyR domain-containing protein [Oscillospiraceae bacterium]
MMEKCMPEPIDTSAVELSAELLELIEIIARNVHEVWAAGRIAEGWQWGEVRDDARRLHPCLVPYEELPESERNYDRHTALETLKLIQTLGFEIKKVTQ